MTDTIGRTGRKRAPPGGLGRRLLLAGAALLLPGCDTPLLSINPNAPPTPGGLVAVAGDEEVFLTWNDVQYSATQGHGFTVFQGTSPQDLTKVAGPFESSTLEYLARGLANGTTYYFAVSAESFGAESPRSAAVSAKPEALYLVEGTGLGAAGQEVRVTRRTVGIQDAVVRVNGTELEHFADGRYRGDLGSAPIPGLSVTLTVTIGGTLVTGTDTAPAAPTLTAPEAGASFTLAELVPVAWTSAVDPDGFHMRLCWAGCTESITFGLADGAARTFQFSPLGLPVDLFADYDIEIVARNDGSFSGRAASGSRMDLRSAPAPGGVRTIRVLP
jgi:hypothetical protein